MTSTIRDGTDADGPALVGLIAECWAEYPGCVMDLRGENPHLLAPAAHYRGKGGTLLVAERDGVLVGTVSSQPADSAGYELKALYVAKAERGTGLAARLLDRVERTARARNDDRLPLWSDTRFTRAHRFYEKHGFLPAGAIRSLGDLSNSLEYPYEKPIAPLAVRSLDAPAAIAAVRPLADLVVGSASADDPGLDGPDDRRDDAGRVWRKAASDVAAGRALLLAGWRRGILAGTVTLTPSPERDGPHRAVLSRLLVAPAHRRAGLGRRLIEAVEAEALRLGRTLLTLRATGGGAAERLFRQVGYQEIGRVAGYGRRSDGGWEEGVFFARALGSDFPARARSARNEPMNVL